MIGAWSANQPVDVTVHLQEESIHNPNLPPLKDAVVTLTLENETKADTIHSMGSNICFTNIPHKYLNQQVHITASCQDYFDVDTMLTLTKDVTIKINRDPSVYGNVRFYLWDIQKEKVIPHIEVFIAGQTLISDENGKVELFVPLSQQQKAYQVTAPFPLDYDSVTMPSAEHPVIGCIINNK